MTYWSRRRFLKWAGLLAASTALLGPGCAQQAQKETGRRAAPPPTSDQAYMAVARGNDPAAITERALAAIGGIERFVKSGDDVILKPNICVNYNPPEYAATTNPTVVATLVRLCLGAGAKRVHVMDVPLGGTPESAYAISGIEAAVKAAGGEMEIMNPAKFVKTAIPEGQDIQSWKIYRDIMTADVDQYPYRQTHLLARLSLGLKNLLGTITEPSQIHINLGQRVADLASAIRPTLTVVDAVRTLMANGPTGGNLNDVKQSDTVIACHDGVAADAWAATLFDLQGADIPYVKAAAQMGLGTLELANLKIEEINV